MKQALYTLLLAGSFTFVHASYNLSNPLLCLVATPKTQGGKVRSSPVISTADTAKQAYQTRTINKLNSASSKTPHRPFPGSPVCILKVPMSTYKYV